MSRPTNSVGLGEVARPDVSSNGAQRGAMNFDAGFASPGGVPSGRRPVRALAGADFRCVANNGFGDGANSYAYSAVWFNGGLYIGSNRHIVPMLVMRSPFKLPFESPPVVIPREWTELDLRGQVWRYDVQRGAWTRVYHAPLVPGLEERMIPQAFGFRGMTVFKGTSDAQAAIYTVPAVGRMALQGVTLRSGDGTSFSVLPAPTVPGVDEEFGSFRAMTAFKDQLFVAPSASRPNAKAVSAETARGVYTSLANTARQSAVLVSSDPASGEWALSSLPVFGDSTNASIIDMAVCGDFLYVGTLNVLHGFQLWRTAADTPPPHRWELVLDRGADRGAYNQAVLSMTEFQGDLYIGTCIQNGGFDRVYQIGPAAGEVLRVRPDGSWDLVVGDPRMTRQGLKVPTSGLRSGFNNPLACYIWRMCAHDGAIYVGTCDNSSFVPFSSSATLPEHVRRQLDPESLERFMERLGGCELWRSTDGDNWMPVTRNGFGNRYNLGIRALVSTPHGLFAGTANPFGPQVAVRSGDGWKYQHNPRGGLEVWQGSTQWDTPRSASPASSPVELAGNGFHLANGDHRSTGADAAISGRPVGTDPAESGVYRIADPRLASNEMIRNPFLRLSATPTDLVGLNASVAGELSEYFGGTARNVGYWSRRAISPAEACRAMVGELCSLLPAATSSDPAPSVLVVGTGGDELLEAVRERFANCQICVGPPDGWPESSEATYDLAICIEVGSRLAYPDYLQRLATWLKPGGLAAVSECLTTAAAVAGSTPTAVLTEAATAAGLTFEELRDVTSRTWVPFFDNSRSYWLIKLLLQQVDADTHTAVLSALPGGSAGVHSYWMGRLRAPEK